MHAGESSRRGRRIGALSAGGVVIALVILVLVVKNGSRSVTLAETPTAYVGSAACGACHPDIHQLQRASNHAQTMRAPSQEWAQQYATPSSQKHDPETGLDYVISQTESGVVLAARDLERGRTGTLPVEYLIGSGHHGFSPLGFFQTQWVFLALSYFQGVGWDLSPVQGEQQIQFRREFPFGELITQTNARRCFGCHTTRLVETGGGFNLPASELGVTCESCHGPGRAHVEAVRARRPELAILNPGKLSAEGQLRVCERCHNPASSLMKFDRDLPPAERLAAAARRAGTAKFQVFGLRHSRCRDPDGGPLRCTTCHNPHANAVTKPAVYNRRCLTCHSSADRAQVTCPVKPRSDCVTCHMPKVKVEKGAQFADHWIRAKSVFAPPASTTGRSHP